MILHHGTTRWRAEQIVAGGPQLVWRDPDTGEVDTAYGFSTARPNARHDFGTPERYARGKATQSPNQGGPVILELDIPDAVAMCSDPDMRPDEYCFNLERGYQELIAAWPSISKRIIPLDSTSTPWPSG